MSNEPATRVELVTPSLPRKCSTTELRRLLRAEDGARTRYLKLGRLSLCQMSYFRDSWGRVDSNHRTHPRTDLQSVAIAAMRLPLLTLALSSLLEPAEGFGPPTPRLQITCSTAELCRQSC